MTKSFMTLCAATGFSVAMAETSTNTSATGMTPEVKNPWEHSVSAGVTLTRGNSQTALFTADFLTSKKTSENEYLFGLGGEYGNNKSVETVNDYKAFAQWNHLFNERLYGYLRADALRDHVASLDYRFTVGPGVGYYFIKDKATSLAGEAGVGFEAEHLGGKDYTFATVRLADRFEHKLSENARIWQTAEFLPQVDKVDNYTINFEIGAEASLTKVLSLKTYLVDSYQSRPAKGKLKNDVKIVAAVAYKF